MRVSPAPNRRSIGQFTIKSLALGLTTLALSSTLSGCQLLKTTKPGQAGGAAAGGAKSNSNMALIAGTWQISYAVGGEVQSAHMTVAPNAIGFEGTGTDDSTGQNFVIDSGFLAGNKIGFHKRYHVDENPNLPPLVYDGTFEVVSNAAYKGPYMKGNYKLDKVEGPPVQGEWDAQKVDAQAASGQGPNAAPPPQAAEQAPPPAADVDPNKAPDLSGKWDAGYEYMFKTFHSRMFLEQDGSKISGHGADKNTNESYAISGTYKFPDIKIIHKYPVLKLSKGKTKPARTLEFRGQVQIINDPDYHGPRMVGKNMGGGDWMAEEVR
ncbi:MAG: hypothetical protein KGS72_17765 [Cyanobacteria bacterium REEB67]|nr:hypothetical protein [Cyanobacteria bacterium REEB67]